VVHTCGGYATYVNYSFRNVFQIKSDDVYWCTADIGWVTGHSYLLYGPLMSGITSVMFEGIPTFPDAGRFWSVIDKHRVNVFYTAPTAIRSLMAAGIDHILPYSLHSLRVLGSVGEPINEEAWHWYHLHVGKEKCPIVDTFWQTETGGIMLSALAGVTPSKPSFAGLPLPGVQPVLLNAEGKEITDNNEEGYLAFKFPWPSMIRTTYGDHERCRITYFSTYKNYYFTGDGARRDENGLYRIIGRVDDVINVSGHRFGTAEIENAINQNKHVIESAVVGYPHDIKGQGIYAFVICDAIPENPQQLREDIFETVSAQIGRIAKPDKIQFVTGLPKTRSGKIMRRILRKVAEGEFENLGDTSTLLDPTIVEEIILGRL
jgi:acetyl-CoA synthetase